ncbi:MAG: hypothetical protein IPP74_01060 [Alphaproteobacteria bacterium]|nr:hypothetical protein [Alphaproteobacteria bacterium]
MVDGHYSVSLKLIESHFGQYFRYKLNDRILQHINTIYLKAHQSDSWKNYPETIKRMDVMIYKDHVPPVVLDSAITEMCNKFDSYAGTFVDVPQNYVVRQKLANFALTYATIMGSLAVLDGRSPVICMSMIHEVAKGKPIKQYFSQLTKVLFQSLYTSTKINSALSIDAIDQDAQRWLTSTYDYFDRVHRHIFNMACVHPMAILEDSLFFDPAGLHSVIQKKVRFDLEREINWRTQQHPHVMLPEKVLLVNMQQYVQTHNLQNNTIRRVHQHIKEEFLRNIRGFLAKDPDAVALKLVHKTLTNYAAFATFSIACAGNGETISPEMVLDKVLQNQYMKKYVTMINQCMESYQNKAYEKKSRRLEQHDKKYKDRGPHHIAVTAEKLIKINILKWGLAQDYDSKSHDTPIGSPKPISRYAEVREKAEGLEAGIVVEKKIKGNDNPKKI